VYHTLHHLMPNYTFKDTALHIVFEKVAYVRWLHNLHEVHLYVKFWCDQSTIIKTVICKSISKRVIQHVELIKLQFSNLCKVICNYVKISNYGGISAWSNSLGWFILPQTCHSIIHTHSMGFLILDPYLMMCDKVLYTRHLYRYSSCIGFCNRYNPHPKALA
jgi:hypothetical protein